MITENVSFNPDGTITFEFEGTGEDGAAIQLKRVLRRPKLKQYRNLMATLADVETKSNEVPEEERSANLTIDLIIDWYNEVFSTISEPVNEDDIPVWVATDQSLIMDIVKHWSTSPFRRGAK